MNHRVWPLASLILVIGITVPAQQPTKKRGGPVVDLNGFKSQAFDSWTVNDQDKPEPPILHRFVLSAGKDDPAEGEILMQELAADAMPRQVFDELKKLMQPPNGKKIEEVCHESELKKDNPNILLFYLTNGTFTGPGPKPRKIDEARVIAAFVSTKEKKFLVRLVGPRQIVSAATGELETFLKDLKK